MVIFTYCLAAAQLTLCLYTSIIFMRIWKSRWDVTSCPHLCICCYPDFGVSWDLYVQIAIVSWFCGCCSAYGRGEHGQDQDWIFFGLGLDLDIHFWKQLDQDRIRMLVWFLWRNFLESDSSEGVTTDGGSVFFAMVFILSVCAALITINRNSCYFIITFFWPSGSSKLLVRCWYAALFVVVLSGICVCSVG